MELSKEAEIQRSFQVAMGESVVMVLVRDSKPPVGDLFVAVSEALRRHR